MDSATRLDVRDHRAQRIAKMREPLLGHSAGDGQQIVAMLERQVRTVTVVIVTAEPLGKETCLRLTLVGEIAVEERPQHGVGADPVVKPADNSFERSMASDALEQIAAGEGMMRLRVGEESTVLHCALFTGGAAIREISYLFAANGQSSAGTPKPR